MKSIPFAGKKYSVRFIKGLGPLLYHVAVLALSATLVLTLPFTISFVAQKFLIYWSFVGNEKIFLISVEVALTVLLILFLHYISRSWEDRKLSKMARTAGLVFVSPAKGFFTRRRIRRLKEKQGFARDVMLIGSTGFRTFVDPKGELYSVIQNCREARIMLLDPNSEGASARAKSILVPDITPETFREQIRKSIDFLKGLKATQKKFRLKLYPDTPFLKLTILGDYIWVQHYHAGLDVGVMPKYVFKHDQDPGGLYTPFYQYFLIRWENPDVSEYDLNTDELIYRDLSGNEARRETFGGSKAASLSEADPHRYALSTN